MVCNEQCLKLFGMEQKKQVQGQSTENRNCFGFNCLNGTSRDTATEPLLFERDTPFQMVLISSPVLLNKQPPAGVENLTSLLIQTLIFFTHKQEVCDVTKSEIYAAMTNVGQSLRLWCSIKLTAHLCQFLSFSIRSNFLHRGPEKSTS